MTILNPGQKVRVLTPPNVDGEAWDDDLDVVDPKYWGKEGDVVTAEWDSYGATLEDPYYRVHLILDLNAPEGEEVCVTDMFWGEELEALPGKETA